MTKEGAVTETIRVADPCPYEHSDGQRCGSRTVKRRPTHAWCSVCGTKRVVEEVEEDAGG